jgi:hypothetical protein
MRNQVMLQHHEYCVAVTRGLDFEVVDYGIETLEAARSSAARLHTRLPDALVQVWRKTTTSPTGVERWLANQHRHSSESVVFELSRAT